MTRVLSCCFLVTALMPGLACGREPPTAPIVRLPSRPFPTEPAPPIPEPPPLVPGELVATYVFSDRLDYAVSGATPGSRYLFYDNGVFGFRYDAFPHVYLGTYQQVAETILFMFGDDRIASAMGTLKVDLLEVRYSEMMQHADYENAVYRRAE